MAVHHAPSASHRERRGLHAAARAQLGHFALERLEPAGGGRRVRRAERERCALAAALAAVLATATAQDVADRAMLLAKKSVATDNQITPRGSSVVIDNVIVEKSGSMNKFND